MGATSISSTPSIFERISSAVSRALSVDEAFSHNQQHEILRNALRTMHGDNAYVWPREVFDDYLVYEVESDTDTALYKRSYVIDEDGSVTFGDATMVIAQMVYTPVAESTTIEATSTSITGDIIPLVEKAIRTDGTLLTKVIQPGWGSSGYYSPELLERDGPTIFPTGLHMYLDHPTESEEIERPERSVKDLAGVLSSDARWMADGPAGPGLYADIKPVNGFEEVIDDLAPHIGVSIRASGRFVEGEAEGQSGRLISEFIAGHSVDFVTQAGAGGQILELFESARGERRTVPEPEEVHMSEQELTEAQTRISTLESQLREMRERQVISDATSQVTAALSATDLHPLTRTRLTESLVTRAPVAEDGTLDRAAFTETITAAVDAALAEYAAVVGAGSVRGMGDTGPAPDAERITALESEYSDALQQAGFVPAQA